MAALAAHQSAPPSLAATNQTSASQASEPFDAELFLTGTFYGFVFLSGIIGNTLIVYSVVHFARMKSLSNIFLASLATADLVLIIFCVPVKFAQLFSFTWTFGKFLCKFVHYIQNLTAICSVYTLTAMSIERYYAIMHPVKCRTICTMSQTRRIIVATWCGSIVLATPVVWIQILRPVGSEQRRAYWCVRDWDNQFAWTVYELYMLAIILIIPLIVMSYSYAHICSKLWFVMNSRLHSDFPLFATSSASASACGAPTASSAASNCASALIATHTHNNTTRNATATTTTTTTAAAAASSSISISNSNVSVNVDINNTSTMSITNTSVAANTHAANHSRDSKADSKAAPQAASTHQAIYIDSSTNKMSQVIKMLIVVVVIFVICWTPILVINVLMAFQVVPFLNYGWYKPIKTTFHLMSYANSCVNPIIYGFMSRNFRASFKDALTRCLHI